MSDITGSTVSDDGGQGNTGPVDQETSNTEVTEPSLVDQLSGNPSWGEIFDKLPGGYREMIAPTLQKWDKNFQDVQTKYSPYKDLVEQGISPEDIQEAMGLRQLASQNPRQIYDVLVQTFGEEWGINQPQVQGQPETQVPQQPQVTDLSAPQNSEFDITQHPKYQELAQKTDTVAEYLASQIQERQRVEADTALETEVKTLQEKYGNFDEGYVFSLAAANPELPLEASVLKYKALEESIRSRPSPSAGHPRLVPTSGGIPSGAVDVGSLSPKDTRGLVQQYLKAALQEQQGA